MPDELEVGDLGPVLDQPPHVLAVGFVDVIVHRFQVQAVHLEGGRDLHVECPYLINGSAGERQKGREEHVSRKCSSDSSFKGNLGHFSGILLLNLSLPNVNAHGSYPLCMHGNVALFSLRSLYHGVKIQAPENQKKTRDAPIR